MGETVNETVKLILSLSVSGGLIALALFALKPFIRNRLSKSFQYYVWLVVLLRFILPFSFGINLMDFTFNTPNELQTVDEAVNPDNSSADPTNINPALDNNIVGNNKSNIAKQQPSTPISTESPKPFDIMKTLVDNLFWIWLAGAVISAVFNILGYLRFIWYIHGAAYAVEMPDCGAKVYKSRFAPTPMLVGVIKPRIYLPDTEYTGDQLNNIMLHELTHLRRRDVWLKWFVALVVSVHWFNPIVYFMRREFNRACELSCDEAVIRNLDGAAKQSYGDTLIAVVAESRYPVGVMSTTMCEEKKKLKERLVAIMNYRKKKKIAVVITTVLAVVITGSALAFGADIIKRVPQSPPEIVVKAGNIDLFYTIGMNKWNGSVYDREDTFKAIMRDISTVDLPYIKQGQTISIEFVGTAPDYVTLTDYILNADGTQKYNITAETIDVEFQNGKGEFTLDKNVAALLSSNSADYELGASIRGFRLVCEWGNNECEYAFIITSDAVSTLSDDEEQDKNSDNYAISLADLRQLATKGDELTFEDFNDYKGQEVGSGLYILYFKVEGGYALSVGGGTVTGKPMYAILSITGIEESIDIRYDDIDGFISKYPATDELSSQIHQYLDIIMSSPSVSSVTGDYIKAHQGEYDAIMYMGSTALPTLRAILDGGDEGLRENIVSLLIQDIVASE